jgi:DNA polymerase I-like protein with 3'-5' exonuclease and polymerase domains
VHTEPTPAPATPGTAQAGIALSIFKRLARKYIIPATAAKCNGLRVAFDIEANGLHDATKVHCIVIVDLDSDQVDQYGPDQTPAALEHLSRAVYLTGHNITGYDLPTLRRLHQWQPQSTCVIVDTLIAARLILPDLVDIDDKAAAMSKTKMRLRGKYSLEAFGMRLGIPKAGADIEDWSKWTPEMQKRCVADTMITKALFQFLQPDGYPAEALALEHRVAGICQRITTDGAPFAVKAAEQLRRQWIDRRAKLGAQLSQQFPGTNLNSRKQLGALLEARGWVPEERTAKTRQPKITDEVLESIPTAFPEFTGLAEYDILRRRLAQLSDGKEAWCKHVDATGRIHGGLVHIGTPHSRAKHLTPNLAQTPNPKRGKPFATECRSLFRTDDDWVFVCCDQSGLQDRAFADYLAEFDAGAYAKAFLNGLDPHWKTAADLDLIAKNTSLDKQNRVHAAIREHSKSFRYAFLFGAGQTRAGHIINNTVRTVHQIDAGNDLQQKFFGNATHPNETALKRAGKQALDKFIAGTPGLRRLRARLSAQVEHHGWLPGLDGRRVPCGAQYTALNYQVTSAEAVITKRWLVRVFDELNEKFCYGWGKDVVIALWVHDEIACCCRPEIADEIGAIMVKHAKEPGEYYKFKVPLDAAYTVGKSWAGKIGGDTDFAGYPNSGQPEITHHGPFLSVEPESDHHAAVENSENSNNSEDPGGAPNEPAADPKTNGGGAGAQRAGNYPHGERRSGRRIATYFYQDHLKGPHTRVEKWRSSTAARAQYPQWFWSDDRWVSQKPKRWTKVPYRLPEMLEALAKDPGIDVFLPEGEKDCETLVTLSLVATTNSEGATPLKAKIGKWAPELNKWFYGVRRLFILADNDEVGRAFAREKARALESIVPDIRIVLFPGVPEGEDVSYWLNDLGRSKTDLLARCEAAERWQDSATLESVRASAVTMEVVDWLWPNHFALGEIGLLVGLPDEGKGQVLNYIAARVTRGQEWPNGEGQAPQGCVILLTSEDDIKKTVTPRLVAAGADCDRIEILKMVRDVDKEGKPRERMFSLIDDLQRLRRKIGEVGNVVAILIDPISSYLGIGKVDSYRGSDVRAVLGPLKALAEEMQVAVIGIMHFNKKVDITNVLLRTQDSLAFVAAPRHVFGVIDDADNNRKLIVRAKNNLVESGQKRKSLAFHFEVQHVGTDPRNDKPIIAPFVVWEPGYVDISATEALQAASENKAPAAVDEAKRFLLDMLANGPVAKKEIEDAAEGSEISLATLRRAKRILRVIAEKDRDTPKGSWFWMLPPKEED